MKGSTPTSGTGISTEPARLAGRAGGAKRPAGFSLLELLVVVVIIGIIASMFTLSVGLTGGDRRVQREVDRLQALLEVASEDAVLQGRELGLRFYPDGYEFLRFDPEENDWVTLASDPVLKARQLDPSLEMSVEIEGRDIELQERDEVVPAETDARQDESATGNGDEDERSGDTGPPGPRPQAFIFSSGDLAPPFVIRLRREFGDLTLLLSVETDGSTEVTREEY